jgi:hypothetical protein
VPVGIITPAVDVLTLLQAITTAARQDMQDGKPHRLSYMAQVVKIVVELKKLAKEVSGACEAARNGFLFGFFFVCLTRQLLEGRPSSCGDGV